MCSSFFLMHIVMVMLIEKRYNSVSVIMEINKMIKKVEIT